MQMAGQLAVAGKFAVYCGENLQDLYDTQDEAEDAIDLAISEEPSLASSLTWAELDEDGDPK